MTKAGRMHAAVLFVGDSADDVALLLRALQRSGLEFECRRRRGKSFLPPGA